MLANNILLFSIGVLLMSIAAVNCRLIRGRLSAFKQWAIDNGVIGWCVYGGAGGMLVAVITFPWDY